MPERQHDSAALAGAALAAVIAIYTQSGPFQYSSFAIGVSILLLVCGYEIDKARTRMQSLALACICALASILVIGAILEWRRSNGTMSGIPGLEGKLQSAVIEIEVMQIWGTASFVIFCMDRIAQAKLRKVTQHESSRVDIR